MLTTAALNRIRLNDNLKYVKVDLPQRQQI